MGASSLLMIWQESSQFSVGRIHLAKDAKKRMSDMDSPAFAGPSTPWASYMCLPRVCQIHCSPLSRFGEVPQKSEAGMGICLDRGKTAHGKGGSVEVSRPLGPPLSPIFRDWSIVSVLGKGSVWARGRAPCPDSPGPCMGSKQNASKKPLQSGRDEARPSPARRTHPQPPDSSLWEGPASSGPCMGSEQVTIKTPIPCGRDEARPFCRGI